MPNNHLGNGKVPLLPVWKEIYLGDRSEATSIDLQEAYGGNLSKNSEVSSEKLSIPALPCQVQERCGNSIGRCSQQGDTSTHGRRWNKPAHNCNEPGYSKYSVQFQKLDQIWVETRKDPILNLLIHYISNGWPCDQRQLPQELHLYWNFWEDLPFEDGIATKGSRLLMPSTH